MINIKFNTAVWGNQKPWGRQLKNNLNKLEGGIKICVTNIQI